MCPIEYLYEIMSKQIKGFHAVAFFIFLVLSISVSLRLGGSHQLIEVFFFCVKLCVCFFLFVLVQVSEGMKLYNNFSYRLGP